MRHGIADPPLLTAVLVSAALVAAVTVVIALLEPRVPAPGLIVLYLLAVVPIALAYGLAAAAAAAVSLASVIAFSYFLIGIRSRSRRRSTDEALGDAPTRPHGSTRRHSRARNRPSREARDPALSRQPDRRRRAGGGGGLVVHSTQTEPLPADTESHLTHFTELVAMFMSNAQSRSGVQRLADEQAALRRVATLIARAAVGGALQRRRQGGRNADRRRPRGHVPLRGRRHDDDLAALERRQRLLDAPGRVSLEGATLPRTIRDTGRPAREDAWTRLPGRWPSC